MAKFRSKQTGVVLTFVKPDDIAQMRRHQDYEEVIEQEQLVPILRNTYDIINGTGLLNGSPTDTGAVWTVTGPGFTTAQKQGNYASGPDNSYCWLQATAPIRRAVQVFQGHTCTLAIGTDNTLANMIHVNFTPNAPADVLYWKTGLGSALAPQTIIDCNVAGNTDDGQPHEYVVEMVGNACWCFADGVLLSVVYDDNFPSLTGQWMFGQLHETTADRLYSLTAYVDTEPDEIAYTVAGQLPEQSRMRAPLVSSSLFLSSEDGLPLFPVDILSNRVSVQSIDDHAELRVFSPFGYNTDICLGADEDRTASPDVRLRRSQDIFGFKILVDNTEAALFPNPNINDQNMVVPRLALGTDANAAANPRILTGTGTPEGNVTAPPGSTFHSRNGNVYRKSTGTGNTGWVAM